MNRLPQSATAIASLLCASALFSAPAYAQYQWSDDEVSSTSTSSTLPPALSSPYGYPPETGSQSEDGYGEGGGYGDGSRPTGAPVRQRLRIDPYIEANQVARSLRAWMPLSRGAVAVALCRSGMTAS